MAQEESGSTAEQGAPSTPAWAFVLRAAYVVSMLAFLLPFATVKSCSGDEVTEYTGVGLLAEGSVTLWIVLGVAALLLVLSFLPRRRTHAARGLVHAARSLAAFLAGFVMWEGVGLHFLLQSTRALAGLYVSLGCWGIVYALSLGLAARENGRMLAQVEHPPRSPRTMALFLAVVALALAALAAQSEGGVAPLERVVIAVVVLLGMLPLCAVIYFAVMARGLRAPAESA